MSAQIKALAIPAKDGPPPRASLWWLAARRFAHNRLAVVSVVVFILILIGAFGAPLLAPYRYDQVNFTQIWKPPSSEHWLGTDKIGRDVFTRLLYGTRTSLIVSFSAQIIVLTVGISLGALAGTAGGTVDQIVMRFVDVVASFPTLLFAILAMAVLGSNIRNLILSLSVSSWVITCQLTRAQILSLRERDYIFASQSFGATQRWIIVQHLIPNIIPPLIVNSTLAIPSYIVAEAGLGFLGIGIMPPTPSLGQLVQEAAVYLISHPTYMLYTALTLAILILSIAFIGDGLREALDPRVLV
jgi:peptide/nickel transport system permease protein